ncbi:winged helix-turn-helix domain-containing protein [Devosia sp. A8/3-2]|nr:winged helix-turn-helix domain-containing protein [Devosia sp. A8/3-2]
MVHHDGDARPDQSAASVVADDPANMILGELVPGTSLPSEAELAGRYEVSRLTIREAVKLLEGRGLLEAGPRPPCRGARTRRRCLCRFPHLDHPLRPKGPVRPDRSAAFHGSAVGNARRQALHPRRPDRD